MMVADVGDTNAQGAVMATSPASMPLHAIEMSGLPNVKYHTNIAVAEPAIAARFVLMATTEMRRSVAPKVDPGFKTHPAEQEDEGPDDNKYNVVRREGPGLTIRSVLSKPRTENHGQR